MSYQAVVKDASSGLVTSQEIGMQMSILQGAEGTAVYVETHQPTTNSNGLVSIAVGTGAPTSGSFRDIDWSKGPYFLQTEIDPAGGTSYTISGKSEMKSLPYAFHATTATTATTAENGLKAGTTKGQIMYWDGDVWVMLDPITEDANLSLRDGQLAWTKVEEAPKYEIGLNNDLGGYVFFISPSGEHGLVAATQDQSTGCSWNDAPSLANNEANHSAVGVNFTDWRLPTKDELNMMLTKRAAIGLANDYYWSSTDYGYIGTWQQVFYSGIQYYSPNSKPLRVRAVRAF
jgi:hypothetical protein